MATASDPKLDALRAHLRSLGSVLVCYSGGVDSAFVFAVAHEVLGDQAIAMTAVGPSLASFERVEAVEIARQIGGRHELVESHEINDENYQRNGTDRCFYCKSELYRLSAAKLQEWNLGVAVNGTNLDDLGDYRPGLEAAKNSGIESPLVACGFTKEDVRRCAKLVGLGVWDKPAAACLASRLPYGTTVTRDRLERIGALEDALHRFGLRQVRVRFHTLDASEGTREAALARVEVHPQELEAAFAVRERIVAAGKDAGFAFVTLDLQGYRTGSHNELLQKRSLPIL
jgi:uncharacterized protein